MIPRDTPLDQLEKIWKKMDLQLTLMIFGTALQKLSLWEKSKKERMALLHSATSWVDTSPNIMDTFGHKFTAVISLINSKSKVLWMQNLACDIETSSLALEDLETLTSALESS